MKIINKTLLQQFKDKNSNGDEWFDAWCLKISQETWKKPNDILTSFPKAQLLKNNTVCFENSENNYVVVVSIHYLTQSVSIQYVGSPHKVPHLSKTNHSVIKQFVHVMC
jgi:mRNA-degrading endonuclease HigB of HigAB toxin-antitoxin module